MKGELKSIAPALENVTRGVTGFVSANTGLISVLLAVGAGLKSAVDETVKYADSVRQLSAISGASTEEASRFLQVLDDYKISAEDAMAATRALTNEGLTPSIDTLARLSDEYLSITDAQQRNEFVLKNLGRSGLQWVEVLNKGSAAIRQQGDAVSDSLVLTQEAVNQAREYEIALDNWNDSIQAAKLSLGKELLPTLTWAINRFMIGAKAASIFYGALLDGEKGAVGYFEALQMATDEVENATTAFFENGETAAMAGEGIQAYSKDVDNLAPAADRAAEALERINQKNQEMMDFILSYSDFQQSYVENHAAAVEAVAEAQRNLNEAIQEEGAGSEAADEATEALQGTRNELQQLEAEWHEKTQRMIYDMVLTKLSVDGLTTAEFNAAQQLGVTMGIFTQAEADKAIAMMQTADALVAQIQQQEELTSAIWGSVEAQQALNDVGGLSGGSSPDERDASTRDAGGMGIAGTPYLIGAGAQPEMFIPSTDGNFIPNADKKMGSNKNVNIVINNPKGQTSEQSMSKAARRLSYLGVLA